jgi:protein SCO1
MSAKPSELVIAVIAAALFAGAALAGESHDAHHHHHANAADEHAQHRAAAQSAKSVKAQVADVRLAEAKLVDQHGTARDFKNDVVGKKIVVIDFVYTTCTTVCPVMSALFAQVQAKLGRRAGGEVALVSMSVDPARDTPARLKEYSARYEAGPGWTWLTGDKQAVDEVLKSLGAYTPNFEDHPALVLVGDGASGKWTRFYGFPDPDQIVTKVTELGSARMRPVAARKE